MRTPVHAVIAALHELPVPPAYARLLAGVDPDRVSLPVELRRDWIYVVCAGAHEQAVAAALAELPTAAAFGVRALARELTRNLLAPSDGRYISAGSPIRLRALPVHATGRALARARLRDAGLRVADADEPPIDRAPIGEV